MTSGSWRHSARKGLPKIYRGAVSKILIGSLVGQGSVLAVSPALTRLYSPADFGSLAIVTAISAILGNVVTLSWERATVVPESEKSARDIVVLGVISVTVLGALLGVAAFALQETLAGYFNSRIFVDFWWLIPATVAVIGYYAIVSSVLVRRQEYGGLAIRNAAQGVVQAISSVILGLVGAVPFGLISSVAVGRIAALATMSRLPKKRFEPDIAGLRKTAREFRQFPLVNTWARVLNSLGLQLPVILIITLFGPVEAGLYALTLRVLGSPVGIVTDAVSQYFEGSFSLAFRTRAPGLEAQLTKLSSRLFLTAIAPVLLVVFLGVPMFSMIFGTKWELAGFYAQLLVISYFAQFVVSPISRALIILGRQGAQLLWDATRVIASVAAIVVPWLLGYEFVASVVALAFVQTVWYIALYVICRSAARSAESVQN